MSLSPHLHRVGLAVRRQGSTNVGLLVRVLDEEADLWSVDWGHAKSGETGSVLTLAEPAGEKELDIIAERLAGKGSDGPLGVDVLFWELCVLQARDPQFEDVSLLGRVALLMPDPLEQGAGIYSCKRPGGGCPMNDQGCSLPGCWIPDEVA